jgi:hypothetical protein
MKVKMANRKKKARKGVENELALLKKEVELMKMELKLYRELGGVA